MNDTSLSLPVWREVGHVRTAGTPQGYPVEERTSNPFGSVVYILRRRFWLIMCVFLIALAFKIFVPLH